MSDPTAAGESAAPGASVSFARFVRYFLGLGTWGFGGPIATVGYMQRDLVEKRGWVSRQDFVNGVALGQTMPGPLAAQVVMWVGYLQRGALGALGTSLIFILPSFVLVLTVAFFYVQYQGLVVVQAIFYGVAPAVMAFIFGSGLAIVPFLREGVVVQHDWLTERQFLDAVAMGLITPGPVVITAAFIGYLVGGFAGAGIATLAIFTPIYLGVVIPGKWFIRHQDNAQVKAFVKGATAAAAGAIGGATIVLTRGAVVDLQTLGILLVSLLFVWRFKNKEPVLVLFAAAAGIALKGL